MSDGSGDQFTIKYLAIAINIHSNISSDMHQSSLSYVWRFRLYYPVIFSKNVLDHTWILEFISKCIKKAFQLEEIILSLLLQVIPNFFEEVQMYLRQIFTIKQDFTKQ